MKFTKRAILLCCIILGIFVSQSAAELSLEDYEVDVLGSVGMDYDDNITFAHEDEKDDFISTLLVGLSLKKESKTHTLALAGNIRQRLFFDNSSFNKNAQDFSVDFKKEFSRFDRVHVSNAFAHAEEPGGFEDEFGRTSGRYSYIRNNFGFEYSKELSKSVALEFDYNNEVYSPDREDLSDSVLHGTGVKVNYDQSSKRSFFGKYDFSARTFDPGETAIVHTLLTGITQYLTKQLSLDVSVGLSFIDTFSGDNSTKPKISVALENDFSEKTQMRLFYRKDNSPSSFSEDIFDSWRIGFDVQQQILRRLKLNILGFWGEGEFKSLGTHDQLQGITTKLDYDLKENIKSFLSYTYSETDSNVTTRNYRRNLVSFGVTLLY